MTWSRSWGVRVSPRARPRASVRNWTRWWIGFMGRPLGGGPYPYLWLDALTQKVREAGRIVNVSVVVATAVNGEGKREIIGMDVGTSEDSAFWLAFLRSLSARSLSGVELVGLGRSSRTPRRHRRSLRRSQVATGAAPTS